MTDQNEIFALGKKILCRKVWHLQKQLGELWKVLSYGTIDGFTMWIAGLIYLGQETLRQHVMKWKIIRMMTFFKKIFILSNISLKKSPCIHPKRDVELITEHIILSSLCNTQRLKQTENKLVSPIRVGVR